MIIFFCKIYIYIYFFFFQERNCFESPCCRRERERERERERGRAHGISLSIPLLSAVCINGCSLICAIEMGWVIALLLQ
jgi:hypothetical protein